MVKDTLVVNLFGSPGSGKSTGAAYLFSSLKLMGTYKIPFIISFGNEKGYKQILDIILNAKTIKQEN